MDKKTDPFLPGPMEKEQDKVWEHMQKHIKQQEKISNIKTSIKDLTSIINRDVAQQAKTKKLFDELKKHYEE